MDNIIYSIYKFVNKINHKVYIGYTSNWIARLKSHRTNFKKINSAFYYAIRKYKWENFTYDIIYQSLDKDHTLNVMEEYFIREYNSHVDGKCGYNMSYGGEGNNGFSADTRYKLGSANRGKKLGPLSEETKQKIGQANSQKCRTAEERQHLRMVNLGKRQSEETILKHSKSYIVTSPNGESYNITNLFRFCKQHCLSQSAMSAIARGRNTKHKGWSCQFINNNP